MKTEIDKNGKRLLIRTFLIPIAGAIVLMIAAARIDWFWGWIYSGLWALFLYIAIGSIYFSFPELINHRARNHENVKDWDLKLIRFFPFFTWSFIALAGLDGGQFHWTEIPDWMQWSGVGCFIAGAIIAGSAPSYNVHFESFVRIQTERDHKICMTGPYRFIRHPGYIGSIITIISAAFILDSWLAFLPAFGNVFIFIVRTAKEDEMLTNELRGYKDYKKKVTARLVPGIW